MLFRIALVAASLMTCSVKPVFLGEASGQEIMTSSMRGKQDFQPSKSLYEKVDSVMPIVIPLYFGDVGDSTGSQITRHAKAEVRRLFPNLRYVPTTPETVSDGSRLVVNISVHGSGLKNKVCGAYINIELYVQTDRNAFHRSRPAHCVIGDFKDKIVADVKKGLTSCLEEIADGWYEPTDDGFFIKP